MEVVIVTITIVNKTGAQTPTTLALFDEVSFYKKVKQEKIKTI